MPNQRKQSHNRLTAQPAGRGHEEPGDLGQRVREGYETARETVAHRYRRAEGMVARNPTPSVLISFGMGFGLGMLLVMALNQREESTWSEWSHRLGDSLRHMPDRLRHVPESIARHMPEPIARHMT
jgi:hypothetical protein